ncbi:MAG: hypothetical protein WC099_01160 [Candidatus Paceibacterota bacterium]
MTPALRNEILRGCVILCTMMLLSLVSIVPFPIKPNIYLVTIILLAFVIDDILVFALFLLGVLLWLKYTPFVTAELVTLGIMGMGVYGMRKMFIRDPHIALIVGTLFVFQVLFWVIFFGKQVFGVPLFMEFLYNVLILFVMYSVWVWVKKIFS